MSELSMSDNMRERDLLTRNKLLYNAHLIAHRKLTHSKLSFTAVPKARGEVPR